jgi:hypothetical protein
MCIHLASDRDQWWAVTNVVINLRLPQGGEFPDLSFQRRAPLREKHDMAHGSLTYCRRK